jgi:ribosomal 30S subunit maturation factor RimM
VQINDEDIAQEALGEQSIQLSLDEEELNDLDDDSEYFDPVGMKVFHEGDDVAVISHFFHNGAHWVYELRLHDTKTVLIPDVERYVIETNTIERYIRVVDLDQFINL